MTLVQSAMSLIFVERRDPRNMISAFSLANCEETAATA